MSSLLVEEKFERRLSEELSRLRVEMHEEISKLRAEMKDEIASLRVEMARMQHSMTRWMFVFWVGQLIAMLGLLIAILSK